LIADGLKIVEPYETIEAGLIAHNQARVARGASEVAKQKARFASAARRLGARIQAMPGGPGAAEHLERLAAARS